MLAQALAKSHRQQTGCRYGLPNVPDGGLSRAVSTSATGAHYNCDYVRPRVGDFDVDLLHEFFQGFVNHAQVTLHLDNLRGNNAHHQAETLFKAFGRALRAAVALDPRIEGRVPSTKGSL